MVELELLGANGDTIVMTDADGERYSIVVDDALRAAVRRDRGAIAPAPSPVVDSAAPVRPRHLQALMRAGATASEVAIATGMTVDHVRRYEGPVLAERQWAVTQAQACRIGWEKDSPLLGELVVDRLATRGVDPACLEWDAVREGREPWLVMLTFIQSAQEKQARWTLDLTARSVHALDDEARWLTEAGAASQRPAVFDQDSSARGASAHAPSLISLPSDLAQAEPESAQQAQPASPAPAASHDAPHLEIPLLRDPAQDDTDALLADLASNRGRRIEVALPLDDDEEDQGSPASAGSPGAPEAGQAARQEPEPTTQTSGIRAQVYSMSERRRRSTGNHPAGSRLGATAPSPSEPSARTASGGLPRVMPPAAGGSSSADDEPVTEPVPYVPMPPRRGTASQQEPLPQMPAAPAPRPKRRSRRSVPSWDEIVFGAKPE
ncbi:septation protein SepH [Actinomyces slackii]|uniref:Protein of uncharacterized function (DUF3071) n=1 Tax=Actinomyces slackii TaxID=52774 RepID=A0A3S5EM93_9ACTO|nr:septation protein SepH [Actinomyces slackii]VEG75064.1 Protein of uncharacterised function (DUF3071) [Actinomyces slackii]